VPIYEERQKDVAGILAAHIPKIEFLKKGRENIYVTTGS
jgi:hypothetical protein